MNLLCDGQTSDSYSISKPRPIQLGFNPHLQIRWCAQNRPERLRYHTCVGRRIPVVALAITQCVVISMCATLPNDMDHIAVFIVPCVTNLAVWSPPLIRISSKNFPRINIRTVISELVTCYLIIYK